MHPTDYKAGKLVYVFNDGGVFPGTLTDKTRPATENDLEYCPSAQLDDLLFLIEFDDRLGLETGPFGFTRNLIFSSFFKADEAREKYFAENPDKREAIDRYVAKTAEERRLYRQKNKGWKFPDLN